MPRPSNINRGFTLLEVVVALAVIAIALAGGISAVSNSTRNAAGLEQRTYAHWVAMNKLAELQLSQQWPDPQTLAGSELLARHEWHWSMVVSQTEYAPMRRVDVRVRASEDDESPLVTLTGYLGRPE